MRKYGLCRNLSRTGSVLAAFNDFRRCLEDPDKKKRHEAQVSTTR